MRTPLAQISILAVLCGSPALAETPTSPSTVVAALRAQVALDKTTVSADARALEQVYLTLSRDDKAKASRTTLEKDRAAVAAALAKLHGDQAKLAKDQERLKLLELHRAA